MVDLAHNTTRHPTPADIRHAIHMALIDDYERHPRGGDVPFIPVRVSRIVDDAISRACAEAEAGL